MIKLHPFDESDFNKLIAEVPDADFLLQWAGPYYTYPLNVSQLKDTLLKTIGEKPQFKVFKAVQIDALRSVGHIQLKDIDYDSASCKLGNVLIFREDRRKGFGMAMVELAVQDAFENLSIKEITLNVCDFNINAIAIYKKIGFVEQQVIKDVKKFQNGSWNLIRMKLNKDQWLQNKKC